MPKHISFAAEKIWRPIPDATRQAILSSVWCIRCRRITSIEDYALEIIAPDLLLTGKCSVCGNEVRRLVETS